MGTRATLVAPDDQPAVNSKYISLVSLDRRGLKERKAQTERRVSLPPDPDPQASMACLGSEDLRDPRDPWKNTSGDPQGRGGVQASLALKDLKVTMVNVNAASSTLAPARLALTGFVATPG